MPTEYHIINRKGEYK